MTIRIKSLGAPNFPEEVWTIHSDNDSDVDINHLYSTIAWLYRCVNIRGNSVAAMPFEIRKGESVVYEYDGVTPQNTPPKELEWILKWPRFSGSIEVASILGGEAYLSQRKNVLGGDMPLRWYLPWSVHPILNGIVGRGGLRTDSMQPYGELLGFWRDEPPNAVPRELEIEDVLYFWYPDHAVEIGRAKNYPAKAVFQNAGVVGALDLFLQGYFNRGLIKATLLKYKDGIKPSEVPRIKEWWKRVFSGVSNAHATEVIRGDFETLEIGEGVKDLRDNVLSQDEKKDIAVGLGVPLSKLLPEGVNRATKDGDDRGYIEETIIPETGWIYADLNEQKLNPMGYSIVALPQQLRVMQTDEVERSQAAKNYFDVGYAKKEIENMLGLHIPKELKEEVIKDQLDILGSDDIGEEKTLLNGIQIESALKIINTFGENVITRDNAINMYDAFLGVNPDVAKRLIPEKVDKPIQTDTNAVAQREVLENAQENDSKQKFLDLLDMRDEKNQYIRWLKARNYEQIDINDFDSHYLTRENKLDIAFKNAPRRKALIDDLLEDYTQKLVDLVDGAKSMGQDGFRDEFESVVSDELESIYREAVGIDLDEDFTEDELVELESLLTEELSHLQGFVDSIFSQKATIENIQDDQGGSIASRVLMWANAARLFFNRGLIVGRREEELTWRLGNTEEHCEDCLRFNGRKSSKSEWLSLAQVGFYPQSRNLACKGYNCDCFMEF